MDALTALHTRNSVNLLTEPGPDQQQLNNIIKAGLKACDHGRLRPWRYIIIEGDARTKFGNLLANSKEAIEGRTLEPNESLKVRNKALRAPTIIAVIAKLSDHPKVPEIEQIMSAAASAQMMVTAAFAQGIGAIWRSGDVMFEETMSSGLNLKNNESIVAFIYLGTPKSEKPLNEPDIQQFVDYLA